MFWPAEAIWEAVAPDLPGFTVEVLRHIDSTNSELMRRAKAGHTEPILLVAEHQTSGRGRLGRSWLDDGPSPSGGSAVQEVTSVGATSLMFSLGLVLNPVDWSGLSLAVGLCVAQCLHPDLRIKWPNDVWLHGRKMAGILIETAAVAEQRFVVVGVGINILPRDAAGLSTPPAWLQEVQTGANAGEVLLRIVPALIQTVRQFQAQGFAPYQRRFNALDALAGRHVNLSDGTEGLAQGVDATGALTLRTGRGLVKITSSEVSVRPGRDEAQVSKAESRPC